MAEKALVHRMEQAALTTKIRLLDLAHQTLIHIGGDLSVCDMMTAIWQYAMHYDVKDPHWEGRDRFVLSKGHAAAVTSFSQAAIGCYDVGDIYKEYATNFGRFGMHSCNLANPYVDVSTGSLGHGFPVASGMATARQPCSTPPNRPLYLKKARMPSIPITPRRKKAVLCAPPRQARPRPHR